jgi:hypothetical protein
MGQSGHKMAQLFVTRFVTLGKNFGVFRRAQDDIAASWKREIRLVKAGLIAWAD